MSSYLNRKCPRTRIDHDAIYSVSGALLFSVWKVVWVAYFTNSFKRLDDFPGHTWSAARITWLRSFDRSRPWIGIREHTNTNLYRNDGILLRESVGDERNEVVIYEDSVIRNLGAMESLSLWGGCLLSVILTGGYCDLYRCVQLFGLTWLGISQCLEKSISRMAVGMWAVGDQDLFARAVHLIGFWMPSSLRYRYRLSWVEDDMSISPSRAFRSIWTSRICVANIFYVMCPLDYLFKKKKK